MQVRLQLLWQSFSFQHCFPGDIKAIRDTPSIETGLWEG
jgi:hypothetical protein